MIRSDLAAGAVFLAAALSVQPSPAQQRQTASADQIEANFHVFFDQNQNVKIRNWRGASGSSDHWDLERTVTSASTSGRCATRFETPRILTATNVARPATTYTLSWGTVSEIEVQGKFVVWRAAHMAAQEFGEFVFRDATTAREAGSRFIQLARACGASLSVGAPAATVTTPALPQTQRPASQRSRIVGRWTTTDNCMPDQAWTFYPDGKFSSPNMELVGSYDYDGQRLTVDFVDMEVMDDVREQLPLVIQGGRLLSRFSDGKQWTWRRCAELPTHAEWKRGVQPRREPIS